MAKILIIDDEAGLRKVLKNIVKLQGHQTEEADDGRIGLEKINTYNPDLVLLDIRLPDMDGLEVLEEARKTHPKLPIIMCSGFSDVETAINTVKMGATDYLSKPFRNDEVIRTVSKYLTGVSENKSVDAIKKDFQPIPQEFNKKVKAKKNLSLLKYLIAGSGILIVGLVIFFVFMKKKEIVFNVPFQNPTALNWDGKNLWVTDWSTQTIYKMKQVKNSLVSEKSYYFPDNHFYGIVKTGENIFTVDSWSKEILKHNLDETLSVVFSTSSPGTFPSGLVWFNNNIWSSDSDTGKIYMHSLKDFSNKKYNLSYKVFTLFSDGKNLWTIDNENKIYKHENNPDLSIIAKFVFPELKSGMGKLMGVCSDGKMLWITFENIPKIVKIPLNNLKKEY